MPNGQHIEALRSAARRVRDLPEVREPDLSEEVVSALRMRGVPRSVIDAIAELPTGAEAAVWSKTYTETHSNRLLDRDGNVIFETRAPLSDREMELIHRLGLRK